MAIYAYSICMYRRIYFQVALIQKYIYMGIYMWKYLACNLEPRLSFLHIELWGCAKMKSFYMYANHECVD